MMSALCHFHVDALCYTTPAYLKNKPIAENANCEKWCDRDRGISKVKARRFCRSTHESPPPPSTVCYATATETN